MINVRYTGRWRPIVTSIVPCFFLGSLQAQNQRITDVLVPAPPVHALVEQYCSDCHSRDVQKGKLDLESIANDDPAKHPEVWEKVARRLRARQMPPADKKSRPDESTYQSMLAAVESSLDTAAARRPNPGRTDTFRRLNRTEYQNAVRDLLAVEIDAAALLPKDELGHGFDNVGGANLSPTLLDRYISAAQKISRLAVGAPHQVGGDTIRIRADLTQEGHVPGLPPGTRGGALIAHTFPQDAEYEIQIRLARDRNEHVEGLHESHDLELLLDRQPIKSFTLMPPKRDKDHEIADQHLKVRVPITAGPHKLGVTFVKKSAALLETRREPYQARFNMHRHPRQTPAVYQVSVTGPYEAKGPGDTPSRRKIFVAKPTKASEEENAARKILSSLMRAAYRRPVTEADLEKPMEFYRRARAKESFDAGIEMALSAILVNPHFLFRVEHDPAGTRPDTAYRISDLDLASRLSFFLWSSIPDEELLSTAQRGELHKPKVLEKQARRMLADPRAGNLARNFGEQWLHLRNLESITPDLRLFPDFDDNLRQALRTETELFFESLLREDRSITELLKADYTFLNERLAKHYGIANVYGSQFRRVALDPQSERGGLLRHGSVLTVTSYATRTSPVLRGKWVLENLLGTPPPPPLPDVPALRDNTVAANLSVRERLAEHRANPACASCHNVIDPVGFSLENFDAVGRWRTLEEGKPVDASGGLPDGSRFTGIAGLEKGLLHRPEVFATTLTEKLLTFALGRGVEYYDGPAIRKIVRDAKAADYRFSSLILGITKSTPFTMRMAQK